MNDYETSSMIDVVSILINQIDHLNFETSPDNDMDYVKKSDVFDLIYGLEDDLYNMSDLRAFEITQSYLRHEILETEKSMWEIEDMNFSDDLFVRVHQDLLQDFFLDVAEDYYDSLINAYDLLDFEIEDLE